MNVWLVNQYAQPPDEPGGTRGHALCARMVAAGHDATILASSVEPISRAQRRQGSRQAGMSELIEGVRYIWVRTSGHSGNGLQRLWGMILYAVGVVRWDRTVKGTRPDIVVGSSPHPFAALAALRIARRRSVPFVLEVRDLWPQSLVEEGGVSPKHPFVFLLKRIERILYASADLIITVMPYADRYLTARGVDPARIVWIPNGVDLSLAGQPSPPADGDEFTVVYAGAHGPSNSLDTVLDAAGLLKASDTRVRFRFYGEGPDKARLMQRAKRESLDNVRFEDPVPKKDVYATLRLADAFVITFLRASILEYGASPNKLFDYFATARPVLWSTSIGRTLVEEADAGLKLPPEDPAALARGVRQLAALPPDELFRLGLNGRRLVEAEYSFDGLAQRYVEALQACLAGSAT